MNELGRASPAGAQEPAAPKGRSDTATGGVVRVCTAHSNTTGQGHQNPTGAGHFKDKGQTNDGDSTTGGTTGGIIPTLGKKQAVVHKDYVLDYASALKDVIITASGYYKDQRTIYPFRPSDLWYVRDRIGRGRVDLSQCVWP